MGWTNEDQKRAKLSSIKIKITSYLTGSVKNNFLLDVIKRGVVEAEVIREIVALHYDILEKNKIQRSEEFEAIRKKLLD